MADEHKYTRRRGDLIWGQFDYPVTRTQKAALDGIWYMLSGLPKAFMNAEDLPAGCFYSQRPDNGDVVIGLYHESINVHRSGRITPNKNPR